MSAGASRDATGDTSVAGTFTTAGILAAVTTVSAAYTAALDDHLILANVTGSGFTITLPPAATAKGLHLTLKRIDNVGGAVTISPSGSDTIEGATSRSLSAQFASVSLISDGVATWYVASST